MTESRTHSDRAVKDASDWLVELSETPLDADKQARFKAWCDADPGNRALYEEMANRRRLLPQMTASDLSGLLDPEDVSLLDAQFVPPKRSPLAALWASIGQWSANPAPQVAGGLAALVALAFVVAVMLQEPTSREYGTSVAEVDDVRLPDGSVVTLGARSRMTVAYSDSRRVVRLLEGEAFFDVEKDASRPFIVVGEEAQVRVLGTKFGVRRGAGGLHVAVEEGTVEVSRTMAPQLADASLTQKDEDEAENMVETKAVLQAGQSIVAGHVGDISPAKVAPVSAPPGAWREGRLIYMDVAFSEVVADINRYHARPLKLASADVGNMRVTGVFLTDRIDVFVEGLPRLLPVALEARADGSILVSHNQE